MKYSWRILTTLLLLVFFVNCSLVPEITANERISVDSSFIYVDSSNLKGPWDGSLIHPFQSISDAYIASEKNDIIFVKNGIYHESLEINKTISIIGENKHSTIIQSSNNHTIFILQKPGIIVQNITFQYAGAYEPDASIIINENNIQISSSIFHHAKTGIHIQDQQSIQINDCLFYQNGNGVSIKNCANISIQHSIFTHNSIGVHIERSVTITVENSYHFVNGIGIFLTNAANCTITSSALFNNNDNRGGIFMEDCRHISIFDSIIQHNGFGVKTNKCDSIYIKKSTFQWNTHIGLSMFEQSLNIIVDACNFSKNLRYSVRGENSQFTIINSNFEQSLYALYNEKSTCNIMKNWWSSKYGPSFFEKQQRQRISFSKETLSFYPWLQMPNKKAGADWAIPDKIFNLDISVSIPITIDFDHPDGDNDGMPDWWEIKYQYDPHIYNDHYQLDPDEDGLSNIQECYASIWDADPFKKDIFLEFDWMESKTSNESNKPTHQDFDMIIQSFADHNISLHIDLGNLGGGEQIPYQSQFNYAQLQNFYWDYFLHNNMENPRKGIFHYGLICDYGPSPGFAVIGWDHLDSFCISAEWLQDNQPNIDRMTLIVGGSIHELGHTLGLTVDDHGGNDNTVATKIFNKQWFKYLPYQSCMNYWYTYKILTFSDGNNGKGDFNDWEHMDLSFFSHTHFDLPSRYR